MHVVNAITVDLARSTLANGTALLGDGGGFCVLRPPLLQTLTTCWPFADSWRPPAPAGPQVVYDASGSMAVVAPGQRVPRPWACAWRLVPPPGALVEFTVAEAGAVSAVDSLRVTDARTGASLINASSFAPGAGAPKPVTSSSGDGLLVQYSAAFVGPVRRAAAAHPPARATPPLLRAPRAQASRSPSPGPDHAASRSRAPAPPAPPCAARDPPQEVITGFKAFWRALRRQPLPDGSAATSYLDSTAVSASGVVFSGNAALSGRGGAAFLAADPGFSSTTATSFECAGCTFVGNSAHTGGALYLEGVAAWALRGSTLAGNVARAGQGGAAWAAGARSAALEGCQLAGNRAASDGGAVWAAAEAFSADGCNFTANACHGDGGALALSAPSLASLQGCALDRKSVV